MHQFLKPRACKIILDTLSAQVPKLSVSKLIRNISDVSQSNRYTRDGHFPDIKVCTSNERIFIGSYPDNQWLSDSVETYQKEILNVRGNDGNHVVRKKKI